jgi:hypothetical protein
LSSSFGQQLRITELAIKYRKHSLAEKYISSVKKFLDQVGTNDGTNYESLHHHFNLVSSKYNLLCAEIKNNVEEKTIYYVNSWKLGHSLVTNEAVDVSIGIKAKRHMFEVTSAICNCIQKDAEYLHLITNDQFIATALGVTSSMEFEYALLNYRYNTLKSACSEGSITEMTKSHEIFAKYCYVMLSDKYDRNLNDLKDLVEAVLRAMTMGCTKTICYFPCLLKYLLCRKSDQNMQLFICNCRNVPTWMFLYWQVRILLPYKNI